MFFYVILFLLCTLALLLSNLLKNKNDKNIVAVSTLILLCLVSGTRYNLGGSDYYIYEAIYNAVPDLMYENFEMGINNSFLLYYEKGYLILNSVLKTLGFSFYGFTLIHSIFFYVSMYFGLKKYVENFSLLIIVFLYKLFFYNTFISMRQSITLAIFFIILRYIDERNAFKYFLGCFIALFIHNAAVVLFPIYFINRFIMTKKKVIILNVVFLPILLASYANLPIMDILSSIVKYLPTESAQIKFENMLGTSDDSGMNLLHTLEYFFIMLLLILNYDQILSVGVKSEFIIKLFIFLLPIFTLFRGYEILTREKDFFTITYAIILGYLCKINKNKYSKIVQFGTVIVCAYGFFRFIILFDNGAMMPYESYLFDSISIFR